MEPFLNDYVRNQAGDYTLIFLHVISMPNPKKTHISIDFKN
jgi:hypothetical protein